MQQFIVDDRGNIVPSDDGSGNALFGAMQLAAIHLTSAELLALHGTPQVLIPAPGAGFLLVPTFAYVRLNYGTATYAVGTNFDLYWGATSAGEKTGLLVPAMITGAANTFSTGVTTRLESTTAIENEPLTITDSAEFTTGDGTADIWVWYMVQPTSAP